MSGGIKGHSLFFIAYSIRSFSKEPSLARWGGGRPCSPGAPPRPQGALKPQPACRFPNPAVRAERAAPPHGLPQPRRLRLGLRLIHVLPPRAPAAPPARGAATAARAGTPAPPGSTSATATAIPEQLSDSCRATVPSLTTTHRGSERRHPHKRWPASGRRPRNCPGARWLVLPA